MAFWRAPSGPPKGFKDLERWWTTDTVAVVTGANKGIGHEAARQLAREGLKVVVAARNPALGTAAVERIKGEFPEAPVVFRQLDIADPQSVAAFAAWAGEELGKIDILLNNAGMAFKGDTWGADECRQTFAVNYYGTKQTTEALLPLIPAGGRVVTVCSRAGLSSILKTKENLAKWQAAAASGDRDAVDPLAEEFLQAVAAGDYARKGYPQSMYGMSKLAEACYTRSLAKRAAEKGVAVSCCCPGYVATDMSSHRGPKTVEQGADTPVWLCLAPEGAKAGEGLFWGERELVQP
ncbi:unnamed protein product [Pedinophyceae sp. YPF-701]|nr:unnamed protein product [Pedinophyceae sp. YPF-701]